MIILITHIIITINTIIVIITHIIIITIHTLISITIIIDDDDTFLTRARRPRRRSHTMYQTARYLDYSNYLVLL